MIGPWASLEEYQHKNPSSIPLGPHVHNASLFCEHFFQFVPKEQRADAAACGCTQRLFSEHSALFCAALPSNSGRKHLNILERYLCHHCDSFSVNKSYIRWGVTRHSSPWLPRKWRRNLFWPCSVYPELYQTETEPERSICSGRLSTEWCAFTTPRVVRLLLCVVTILLIKCYLIPLISHHLHLTCRAAWAWKRKEKGASTEQLSSLSVQKSLMS